MAKSFASQVGDFVAKSDARMTAVFRQSAQDVIEEAQTDYTKGGNLPKDTGFLQSTGDAALNRIPSGPTVAPEGVESFTWDADAALVVIAQAQIGDTIFFGWSAEYSEYMENRFGFMRLAAQNWQQIVRKNAQRLERSARG
tara:strand:+ start:5386 stop:5808 length:423 start_codon:yes stop_codon:yes gene_type:complete